MLLIPRRLSDFFPALLGDRRSLVLFVDDEIAGQDLYAGLFAGQFLAFFQLGNDAVDAEVLVGGLLAGAADDERGASFVDQDGIHFVDDGEVVRALHAFAQVELHIVAEIIESELVVGAVGYVAAICVFSLLVIKFMHDDADGESQESVDLAHPLGVAFRQVVINGNDVNSAPVRCIQVHGQRRDQRFTFAGLHFRNFALVQHHAADQLHVEMPHIQNALAASRTTANASSRISSSACSSTWVRSFSISFWRWGSASNSSFTCAMRS